MPYRSEHEARQSAEYLFRKWSFPSEWRIEVWNNLGWHICFRCGAASVHYALENQKFYSLISDDLQHIGCGSSNWTSHFTSDSPWEVLLHDMEKAELYIQRCRRALDSVIIPSRDHGQS